MNLRPLLQPAWSWLRFVLLGCCLLQLLVVARVALLRWVDPVSTTFERSQIWQLAAGPHDFVWRQQWLPLNQLSKHLQRAVIACEDDIFSEHGGVRWNSIELAWKRNERAQNRAADPTRVKLVGGSTITQQLAKNLLLSGERTLLRKGQELVITYALEAFLSKSRILELYLNHVEWGRGTFGAQAASLKHFKVKPSQLDRLQAAKLAALLPRPRLYELHLDGPYVTARAFEALARMSQAVLPNQP